MGLTPASASAISLIDSGTSAESQEEGEDSGGDLDGDQTDQAGVSVTGGTFRCPGTALCDFLPGESHGAFASAETSFGSNRASAFSESGRDLNQENDVRDRAAASSFWEDDWTFSVSPSAAGKLVSLEFHFDGSWSNGATAQFEAGVFDASITDIPGIEDPPRFLPIFFDQIAGVHFDSSEQFMFVVPGFPGPIVPIEDGGQPDGAVDITVTIQFVPTAGHTYIVGSRLFTQTHGEEHNESADFDSTAELTRVIVPDGVTFTPSSGFAWNVEVPEPAAGVLLAFGAAATGAARARSLRKAA